MLAPTDTVLFKASRGIGLDRAVALLTKTGPGTKNSGLDR
jgi:UDP-N-acetylmuramyl pentapeptide synthase